MKQRIITAVAAAAVFLPIVIFGGLPFIAMVYLIASVALYEALNMRKLKLLSVPGIISLVLLWVFMIPEQYLGILDSINYTKMELFLLGVLLFLTYTVITKNRFTFEDVAFSILSTLYVGLGFYFFIETREASLPYVFYSLFMIWATDSGAYFIGRAIGKRKLWPEISPNKTTEGFFGGVVSALAVAILFSIFADMEVSVVVLLAATAFLSVFGQVGDLVESAMKRHYNVKDSGKILPGHGGMLDRFDSLLFVWPLIHLFHLL
ncbi:phosphatidate cytidylyltransferase [Mesobacillus subterraneus]|uniref:phosphatidate cytidylyltransferase n=1 Tax=Mesobacillus subterraneus TaxID=285983 RepID=UPI0020403390|nr:phosphatidate cytidylyltransferase [Mesobacillus subterraneus]MCM3665596.1 phosphatidate cytidylyltransferase [Mesobacillus subterraneus]MCM3684342.1 phosphatidate cytidylyltransferase [Mesobacillus subterraneus]